MDYSNDDMINNNAGDITIQWFPGHMAKTKRLIEDNLKQVDMAAEIIDARIPLSSRNPVIDTLLKDKKRLILLNKADLSDKQANKKWCEYFEKQGVHAILISCNSGLGINSFYDKSRELVKEKIERDLSRGMKKNVRVMIVGVPNVGKSSFINKVAGDKRTKVEDRPGVTRMKQWIRLSNGIDLLDTPGILWPKFEDKQAALNLAYTGAIKDDIYDYESVAILLCKFLAERYPAELAARYKIKDIKSLDCENPLEVIGRRRGFLISGGEIDTERTSRILLDEFRAGKIGNITLEWPEE